MMSGIAGMGEAEELSFDTFGNDNADPRTLLLHVNIDTTNTNDDEEDEDEQDDHSTTAGSRSSRRRQKRKNKKNTYASGYRTRPLESQMEKNSTYDSSSLATCYVRGRCHALKCIVPRCVKEELIIIRWYTAANGTFPYFFFPM
jgi:hypothetical protein